MKRCPKCRRFGVKYDSNIGKERCIWKNCHWVNEDNEDLYLHDYGINFTNFIDAIKEKDGGGRG